jgi:hypothetical protein
VPSRGSAIPTKDFSENRALQADKFIQKHVGRRLSWKGLVLGLCLVSGGCDKAEQSLASPDSKCVAEVVTSSAPATDASTTYVRLWHKGTLAKHIVFGGSNYGARIRVAWIDSGNLTIRCDHCSQLERRVKDEQNWQDIAIHYEISDTPQ